MNINENSQQNIHKLSPKMYKKNFILRPSTIYSRYASLAQY